MSSPGSSWASEDVLARVRWQQRWRVEARGVGRGGADRSPPCAQRVGPGGPAE